MKENFIRLGLDGIAGPVAIPRCDYVYFATPSRASFTITRDFVATANVIVAHAHNSVGIRMPLVPQLRPGHTILLAYGSVTYQPIFRCTVCASLVPVRTAKHIFDVFSYLDESLHARLREGNYQPDPLVCQFIGIAIEPPEDLGHIRRLIIKPRGNNTLRRWDEVFKVSPARPD